LICHHSSLFILILQSNCSSASLEYYVDKKELSFLFTKKNYSCLYNLLLLDPLLAYSKGTKNNRAATFTHKIQREKKTRLNFFAKLQSFFSLPLFLLEKAF